MALRPRLRVNKLKTKKIPQRMCLGCQQVKPKRELIRIVRSPEGEFSVDMTGKKPGRGAYICPSRACFVAARKNHGLERSFKSPIEASIYDALEQELSKSLGEA